MNDAEFLTAFENCTLTKADWTHAAHVRMAWLYLSTDEPFEDVFARVREGIQRLNRTVLGKPEGYHETITYAFLRLILVRMRSDSPVTFTSFCVKHPELLSPGVLLAYYSKTLLESTHARQNKVPPDLAPLP